MNESRATKLLREIGFVQGKPFCEAKDVPAKHQMNIALKTLSYSDAGASVMGGMTKKEAIEVLRKNGYDDKKLTKVLKKSGYTDEEIKKLLEGK
jgi:hypothetical protein